MNIRSVKYLAVPSPFYHSPITARLKPAPDLISAPLVVLGGIHADSCHTLADQAPLWQMSDESVCSNDGARLLEAIILLRLCQRFTNLPPNNQEANISSFPKHLASFDGFRTSHSQKYKYLEGVYESRTPIVTVSPVSVIVAPVLDVSSLSPVQGDYMTVTSLSMW
ncbi:hypothetical protein DFH29DRAFT_956221 [Suillus ampliporus]|nr:hypothetical protein DFH29DRAFT_956221 [Suillus ampliporus]